MELINSVVVMNNELSTMFPEIIRMIEEVGTIGTFLPSYSSDQLRRHFSKVKSSIKDLEGSDCLKNDAFLFFKLFLYKNTIAIQFLNNL